MIPSYNILKTVEFLQEVLGFSEYANFTDYVILGMNNLTIHILHAGPDTGEMSCYLEVDNVDAAWEKIRDKMNDIEHKAPFLRDYGMKEIHLVVPETKTLLFIGQMVKN
jgi:hypothetical protein